MRKKSKLYNIKILLDSGASVSIVRKHVLHERKKFLKIKRINGQQWQGPLKIFS